MDLLVKLSDLKSKSIAYRFNNFKFKKIIIIQKKREQIVATVEKLKDKLFRWRQLTRTTLEKLEKKQESLPHDDNYQRLN